MGRARRANCCRQPGEQSGLLCGKVAQRPSPASRDRDIYTDALEAFQLWPIPEEGRTAGRRAVSARQGERIQTCSKLCWGQVGTPVS